MSYNSTSLWVKTCKLIIRLWVGNCIILHYIKSTLLIYIISSLYIKKVKAVRSFDIFLLWYTPETSPCKIYCDLNGNELEKYAIWKIWKNILQKQLFTSNGITLYRFWKIPKKTTAVESCFRAVTGLAILLKMELSTCVFVLPKIFRTDIFYLAPLNSCF